jgi:hypothetical protein
LDPLPGKVGEKLRVAEVNGSEQFLISIFYGEKTIVDRQQ